LRRILLAALDAAAPALAVRRALTLRRQTLRVNGRLYDLRRIARVVAIGAGKASVPMARRA
jgi:glycerate-2-kinase